MRIKWTIPIGAALLVAACGGGGQTEPAEAEENLANDLQPAAPSPGTVVPDGGGGTAVNGAADAPTAGNGQ